MPFITLGKSDQYGHAEGNISLACDSEKNHTHDNSRMYDSDWAQTGAESCSTHRLRVTEFHSSRDISYIWSGVYSG